MITKKSILLFLFCGLSLSPLFAQNQAQEVSGAVFLDGNKNGRIDTGENGVADVLVSNQHEIVTTDDEGRYTLSVTPGQSIMIIKPSDYDVPVDEYNIPQFSYEYEPQGSPNLKYGGLAPTGSLPKTVNFPLYRAEHKEQFNALIFGDPQPRDNKELDYIRDTFVGQAANEEAAFMLILGDIMYNDLSMFKRHKKLMAETDKPIWHIIGNHDIDFDAKDNRHARDTYKQQLGANYYAFQYGKVTFVALDNIDYLGRDDDGRSHYRGKLWGDQLSWLENLLTHVPDDHLIIVGTHIPLYAWNGEAENVNTVNRDALFKLLKNRANVLALSGHLHMTYHYYFDEKIGWEGQAPFQQLTATTVSGTWWGGPKDENNIPVTTQRDGVPNGYHRFTFNRSSYTEQLIGLEESENMQIRIELPSGTISSEEIPDELLVNVLNGNAKNRVWYRLNEGTWTEMRQVTRSSPYYEYLLETYPDDWSSSLQAIPTNHLWASDLNINTQQNTWSIDVKTIDAYGKEWRETKVIEIRE